jgi:hypothetical protein
MLKNYMKVKKNIKKELLKKGKKENKKKKNIKRKWNISNNDLLDKIK